MARIIDFPFDKLSDKDKKIINLEVYIKTNLIELAKQRRKLDEIRAKLLKSQLKVIKNESDKDSS